MITRPRRRSLGVAALMSAGIVGLTAVPALAVTVAAWPTGGYVPTSCVPSSVVGASDGLQMTYTDTQQPTITGWTLNNSKTVVVVGPTGVTGTLRATAVEGCSGVGFVDQVFGYRTPGGVTTFDESFATPSSTDAFAGTWDVNLGPILPSDSGTYTVPLAAVARRYDSFVLDQNFQVVGTPVDTLADPAFSTGAWSTQKVYVLRQSTLTATQSATTVASGTTVSFLANLKYATDGSTANNVGGQVVVQTKVGTGAWTTRATLAANGSGNVSWSFAPTTKTYVRFVHNQTTSGVFTSTVVSATKTVSIG